MADSVGQRLRGNAICRDKHQSAAVVVVTMMEDTESVFAAMRAGACGYVVKGADRETMFRSIRAAARGEVVFSAQVADHILSLFRSDDGQVLRTRPFQDLTEREFEVLQEVASGLSNAEIGQKIGLSAKTVANYLSQVFVKLQVSDRSGAIVKARNAGVGGSRETLSQ